MRLVTPEKFCCSQSHCGRQLVLEQDSWWNKNYENLFAIAWPSVEQITFYCKFHVDEKWRWLETARNPFKCDAILLNADEYKDYAATIEVVEE